MSSDSSEDLLLSKVARATSSDEWHFEHHEEDSKLPRRLSVKLSTILLVLSVCANVAFIIPKFWTYNDYREMSKFASLSRNETGMLNPYGAYGVGNDNETDRSIMWEKLEVSLGSVAIDLEWAKQKGLPEAQKFPWDHSKGIYLLNGHHSLHCLRKIRRWVTIAHHNGTQLDTYSHVVHCADLLLQNILCDADDTPIYTTASVKKDAGLNQQRQCRSWEALNAWAETQTACYAFINETQSVNSTLERYKYCPQGSPYADTMRSILGYPSKWRQDRPANFESIPHYWENFTRNSLDFHEDTDI